MRRFVPFVEGMRGLCALYVMLAHMYGYTIAVRAAPALLGALTGWLNFGSMGVAAFIVISGYCLALPLASGTFDARRFLQARARRILPPYWAALAVSTVVFLTWARLAHHPVRASSLAVGLLSHALLLHNLISHAASSYINGAMWSVALEAQIYLVFAFGMVWAMRRFGIWPTLALTVALSLVPVMLWTEPYLLGAFAMGAAAATTRIPRAGWVAVAFGILTVVLLAVIGRSALEAAQLTGAACVAALIAAQPRGLVAMLESRPVLWLGAFSYSLYLLHLPLVNLLSYWLNPMPAARAFAIYVCLAAPAIVLFAYAFYLVAERPFISRFRRRSEAQTLTMPTPADALRRRWL